MASRRLRTVIDLFADCFPPKQTRNWEKQIRSVTSALGEARDADVQIELLKAYQSNAEKPFHPGIRRLLLRIGQKREQLQEPINQISAQLLNTQFFEQTRSRLAPFIEPEESPVVFSPVLYRRSYQYIHQRAAALLSYQSIVDQPEKQKELHEMRITAKWLRYSIETFSPLYGNQLKSVLQTTRKIQELLGDIHDCDVWAVFLPQFIAEERQRTLDYFGNARSFKRIEPGLQAFYDSRLQIREQSYHAFIQLWQTAREANLWVQLDAAIQAPLLSNPVGPANPSPE